MVSKLVQMFDMAAMSKSVLISVWESVIQVSLYLVIAA
jgi:hypothetical protein